MAITTSGQISIQDIMTELGVSGQSALNDEDIRGLIDKSSGAQMSMSEWYGASAIPPFDYGAVSVTTTYSGGQTPAAIGRAGTNFITVAYGSEVRYSSSMDGPWTSGMSTSGLSPGFGVSSSGHSNNDPACWTSSGKIYRSTDNGVNWTLVQTIDSGTTSRMYYADGYHFFLNANGKIYRSSTGTSFTSCTVPASMQSPRKLAYDGSSKLIAIDQGYRTYYSTNSGSSWTEGSAYNTTGSVASDITTDGSGNWAISQPNNNPPRICFSTNNGTSWTDQGGNISQDTTLPATGWYTGTRIRGVAYDTTNSRFLVYGSARFGGDSILATSNNGSSWTAINNGDAPNDNSYDYRTLYFNADGPNGAEGLITVQGGVVKRLGA
jgi:hypothetical protein